MESREHDSSIIVRSKLSNTRGLACIGCLMNVDKVLTFMRMPGHENLSEFVQLFLRRDLGSEGYSLFVHFVPTL